MVIAVIVVWVVQTPVDEIVGVVCVWDALVAAIRAVKMVGGVTTGRLGMTVGGVRVDGDDVLIDMILMRVMQVPVVPVIGVAVMHERRMPAARTVNVVMRFVNVVVVMAHLGSASRGLALHQSDAPEKQPRTTRTGEAARRGSCGAARVLMLSSTTSPWSAGSLPCWATSPARHGWDSRRC